MYYDIYMNNEMVGSGLSHGELNQWLLNLSDELTGDDKYVFKKDLGAELNQDLEDFLYASKPSLPLRINHKDDVIILKENDF